ncbi:MAG: Fe-S protein assembly co-chaperone HscB [Rickettsiales bacterium]|nr:Fe-S protein assembly co-chaperone HscB [Rickettsiales bacterium]
MSRNTDNIIICFFCRHKNVAHQLFCQNCNKILTANTNFFIKFGYPVTFDINPTDCKNRYLKMQSQVHPDLFVKKSEIEQTLALNVSSYLNDAFNTLKDNLSRSKYILKLHNIDIDNHANSYFIESPEFLDEILDLNEEQSQISGDAEQENFAQKMNSKITITLADIANDFKVQNYNQAAIDTIKLSYYQKASKKYN